MSNYLPISFNKVSQVFSWRMAEASCIIIVVAKVAHNLFSQSRKVEVPREERNLYDKGAAVFSNPKLLPKYVQAWAPDGLDLKAWQEKAEVRVELLPPVIKAPSLLMRFSQITAVKNVVNIVRMKATTILQSWDFPADPPSDARDVGWMDKVLEKPFFPPMTLFLLIYHLFIPIQNYLNPLQTFTLRDKVRAAAAGLGGVGVAGLVVWLIAKEASLSIWGTKEVGKDGDRQGTAIGRVPETRELISLVGAGVPTLLVARPGAGKTHLVVNAAKYANSLPKHKDRKMRIFEINADLLDKNKKKQILGVLEAIYKKRKEGHNIVLFVDEYHRVVTNKLQDIFKLWSEKVPIIGATTTKEYKKHFKDEDALKRRHHVMKLEKLSNESLKDILISFAQECYPQVQVDSDALDEIIELSNQQDSEAAQPSRAKKLLKECLAKINSQQDENQKQYDDLVGQVKAAKARYRTNGQDDDVLVEEWCQLSLQLKQLEPKAKERARKVQEFKELLALRKRWNDQELNQIIRKAAKGEESDVKAYAFVNEYVLGGADRLIDKKRKEGEDLPLPILSKEVVQSVYTVPSPKKVEQAKPKVTIEDFQGLSAKDKQDFLERLVKVLEQTSKTDSQCTTL